MDANHRRQAVIKRDHVRVDEGEARARPQPVRATHSPCASTPRVRLLRLDEHTQAIEFSCACGEVSLIEIESEKKP